MIAGSYSMMGSKHKVNQDSMFLKCQGKKCLCAVADGMGGHNAGDVASRTAINIIGNIMHSDEKSLALAFEEANRAIFGMSECDKSLEGMGTTIVLAAINKYTCTVMHVGDSRAYGVTQNHIKQITTDHSYVQELVDNGKITPNEAKNHPMKNIITKAVGVSDSVTPNIKQITFNKNDILVLCSDGVSGALSEEEIITCCHEHMPPEAAEALCRLAVKNGATDDVTAIVVKID